MSTSSSKLEKWEQRIMHMPMRRLDKEVYMSGQWCPTFCMKDEFQVAHAFNGHQFIVDVGKKTCSCNFWEFVGIPCRHAVVALGYRKQKPIDFVDHYYTKEKYALCYGFGVSPINGMDMWPEPENAEEKEEILPPMYKTGPGRPKKLRIREFDEAGCRKRKRGVIYKCTKCGDFRHNRSTCKSKTQDPDALKRKRKPPKGKTTSTKANQGKANSSAAADQGKATSIAAAEGQLSHSPIEPLVNVSQSQVEEVIDASQSLFDEIPDEVIATIPEVNPDDIPKEAKVVRKRVVKGKVVNDKKEAPVRRRQSENRCWFNSGPTFSYNRC
ncbi:hypothetical protein P8452_52932 [Trifolium repens]|nr:hypothetical protein P8452_52932 [Trifolium repens]